MSMSIGVGDGIAPSPKGVANWHRWKSGTGVHILLLLVLGVMVVVGLVCDAGYYHGVDVRGRPIYPEILMPPNVNPTEVSTAIGESEPLVDSHRPE